LHQNDLQGNALLLDDSMELGVAPGAGVVMNSGELLPVIGRDVEKERDWEEVREERCSTAVLLVFL
jgi:hypothetical protein